MAYVIHKRSRLPNPKGSYSGVTWTLAGLMARYKRFYDDKDEAEDLARRLTKQNPVGFEVSEIP